MRLELEHLEDRCNRSAFLPAPDDCLVRSRYHDVERDRATCYVEIDMSITGVSEGESNWNRLTQGEALRHLDIEADIVGDGGSHTRMYKNQRMMLAQIKNGTDNCELRTNCEVRTNCELRTKCAR